MNEDLLKRTSNGFSRRGFIGGVSSLLAAARYSRSVPEPVTAQLTDGDDSETQTVSSPDGSIEVTIKTGSGVPMYGVEYDGTTYITDSGIGFDFKNQDPFALSTEESNGPAITVTGSETASKTETWDPVWGQYDSVSKDYNLLRIGVEEMNSPGRSLNLEFRVFNDGLGFRVTFDNDFTGNSDRIVISSENTEFNFADNYTSWWIENTFVNPRFEQEYSESNLSSLPSGTAPIEDDDGVSPKGNNDRRRGVHTPLTVEADDGTHISVHEADLDDYATMSLAPDSDDPTNLSAELAPLPDGTKVSTKTPHVTPWRTIQLTPAPGELIESSLIPLLNEPLETQYFPGDGSGGTDTDWMAPRMYIGIWWTMIAGSANWEYKSDDEVAGNPAAYVHGARTERMKRYMRFAGRNGIDSVLVEGWNEGWDSYGAAANGSTLEMGVADSYPDFDVPTVTNYGSDLSSPVEMTIHNETSGNLYNYEDEINSKGIFSEYEAAGIRSIKNGYVNDFGLYDDSDTPDTATTNQHSQLAVDHHRTVIRNAAQHRQTLEIHEGIKPTGERRTYPNVAAREVVLAQEYDGFGALGSGVGREHHVTLPFTRMLAGPTSYQPGIFDITFNDSTGDQIQTTRAKQLAMYPNYNAGIQMAADRVEAYVDSSFEVGEYVQAQCGDLDGMITADKWRNAFGAHYVPIDPNRVESGSSVSFTVEGVSSAGDYELHLRYASDEEENTQRVADAGGPQATLNVNGSEREIRPNFTDYWDDWQVFTTTVSLQEGDNAISIELDYDDSNGFTGDVGGFNVNTIGVTAEGAGPPFPAAYSDLTDDQIENENFEYDPDFKYIEDVPAGGWDDSKVLDGQIGDYLVTARRKDNEWYVGGMTDGQGRELSVEFGDFFSESSTGNGWKMEMYADAPGTDIETNPTEVRRTETIVRYGENDTVRFAMAAGGGTAVRLVPATDEEASALSDYSTPGQVVASFDDPEGDDTGDGSYSYPEASEFTEGCFDLDGFTIEKTPDEYRFSWTVDTLENPFGNDNGFSPQMFVVWLRDPTTEGGAITPAEQDIDPNMGFADAWDYRLRVDGTAADAIDSDGSRLTGESGDQVAPTTTVDKNSGTVTVAVPRAAFDTDLWDMGVLPVVGSENDGTFRSVVTQQTATDAREDDDSSNDYLSDRRFVTSNGSAKNAPRIMDMITPASVSQSDALSYSDDRKAQVPFTPVYTGRLGDVSRVLSLNDSTTDSYGPATGPDGENAFSYPATEDIKPADHDIERVEIYESESEYTFLVRLPELRNPASFEANSAYGYGLQHIQIYVSVPGGETGSVGCRDGVHAFDGRDEIFGQEYHRRIVAHGFDRDIDTSVLDEGGRYPVVESGFWEVVADADSGVSTRGIPEIDAIEITVPQSTIPSDIRKTEIVPMMFSYAGGGTGEIRKVQSDGNVGSDFDFGGAPSSYYHNNILDIVLPEGVSQADILDPTAGDITPDNKFSGYDIPFVSLSGKANTIREALAGNGPVTTAHFEEVKEAYETESAVAGTGGLVPDYDDLRSIAREVQDR
jgi:carbohydrate-binding DOMON domain-containing protein